MIHVQKMENKTQQPPRKIITKENIYDHDDKALLIDKIYSDEHSHMATLDMILMKMDRE